MNPSRSFLVLLLIVLLVPLAALAQPKLASINPSSVTAGTSAFTLSAIGDGFVVPSMSVEGSVVLWYPAPNVTPFTLTTQVASTNQALATVPATLVTTPGTAGVAILNQNSGQISNTVSITITASTGPLSIVSGSPLPNAVIGDQYGLGLVAEGGIPPYFWEITAGTLPPGLNFFFDGSFAGVPTTLGTYTFTARVRDQQSATQSRQFVLRVVPELSIITGPILPGGRLDTPYSLTLQASGGRSPYYWTLVPGLGELPTGLFLGDFGEITGTPQQTGTFEFTAEVYDQREVSETRRFSLTISDLAITTVSPLPDAAVGTPYSVTLNAANGTLPYLWRIVEGQLPPGLTLSPSSGVLSGTPTQANQHGFLVRVTDARQQTADKSFTLTVNQSTLQITTQSPLTTAVEGESYSFTFAASGGSPPYDWSLGDTGPPPGLTFSSAGVLEGTPSEAGTYTLPVMVYDNSERMAAGEFTLEVIQPRLQIITESLLSEGTVGQPYSQTLEASGGAPPYSWSVQTGSPPNGLTLSSDGVLSGDPSVAGDFTFQARVTDTGDGSATRDFSIHINAIDPPVVSFAGLPDQTDPAQTEGLQVNLSDPYPVALTGVATLTFEPDATNPSDDPAVQFATGGRTVNLDIPAGQTSALFGDADNVGIVAGSVAGRIRAAVELFSDGVTVTPDPVPATEMVVRRTAPTISSVNVARVGSGFEVQVRGMSSPRDMTQALFRFAASSGANLQTTQATVTLDSAFTSWYQNTESEQFGSTFLYVQPFSISGDSNAVSSVTVTLTNSQGDSGAVSSNF